MVAVILHGPFLDTLQATAIGGIPSWMRISLPPTDMALPARTDSGSADALAQLVRLLARQAAVEHCNAARANDATRPTQEN